MILKMAIPFIKSATDHIGKQALSAGAHIEEDLVEDQSMERPLVNCKRASENCLSKLMNNSYIPTVAMKHFVRKPANIDQLKFTRASSHMFSYNVLGEDASSVPRTKMIEHLSRFKNTHQIFIHDATLKNGGNGDSGNVGMVVVLRRWQCWEFLVAMLRRWQCWDGGNLPINKMN
uniref:Uncharacterized protein n=1 Tax=Romanomermis culicivorax TaxID=13658 RepID=A0A915HG96_ROMCU